MSKVLTPDASKLTKVEMKLHTIRPSWVQRIHSFTENSSIPRPLYCEHGVCLRHPDFALFLDETKKGVPFPVAYVCQDHVPRQLKDTTMFRLAMFSLRSKR